MTGIISEVFFFYRGIPFQYLNWINFRASLLLRQWSSIYRLNVGITFLGEFRNLNLYRPRLLFSGCPFTQLRSFLGSPFNLMALWIPARFLLQIMWLMAVKKQHPGRCNCAASSPSCWKSYMEIFLQEEPILLLRLASLVWYIVLLF